MATVEGDIKGAELTYRLPTVEVARWMAAGAVPEIRVKWPDGRVEVLPLELKMIADQPQADKGPAPQGVELPGRVVGRGGERRRTEDQ